MGAGPPIDQLALPAEQWLVHVAVVKRANDIRRDELSAIHDIQWLPVPPDDDEDEEEVGVDGD